jgi:MFS family permease
MKTQTHTIKFISRASIAAFGAYFCMYAFRKPFAVATFENLTAFGIDYKILLIIAQVLGYMLSKFIGIKIISELKPKQRVLYLLALIGISEIALILFGWIPQPYNIICMFLNGLPLGMIWGIVFSYLEGRKYTEILGVILCTSFIVSSGVVKSVGLWVMSAWGVSQFWMPAITGALFIIPLIFFAWLLETIPPPTEEDKELRVERVPMHRKERLHVIRQFALPLFILIIFYTILTAFRDLRDNYARELWDSLGYAGDISVYSTSEIAVALLVLVILASVYAIKDNFKALLTYHGILLIGTFSVGIATVLLQSGYLDPFYWMVISGFGLYICYVPFNALFFDRFIAAFRISGNAGFLIYLADAFGYMGSMAVLLYKNFGMNKISWLQFFVNGAYLLSILGTLSVIISFFQLRKKHLKSNFKVVTHES